MTPRSRHPSTLILVVAAIFALGGDLRAQPRPADPTPPRRRPPREARQTRPASPPAPARSATPPRPTSPAPGRPTSPGRPARRAAPAATPTPADPAPGDDADLYRCKRFPRNARIKVTLKPETELRDLVTWVMGFTCRNFIFGTGISQRAAKVTVIAPSEMSPSDAYRLFLVALQTMNLTVVPKGNTLEIVEAPRAREAPLPVYEGARGTPSGDQMVRVVIRPEHANIDELAAVLNAMKSANGVIAPIPSAGVLIVTDYGSSISRMREVLREVDAPGATEKIYIVQLLNADAQDVATKLTEIFGAAKTGAPAPRAPRSRPGRGRNQSASAPEGSVAASRILADVRTNSLIVIASERAYLRILALIRRLDAALVDVEGGSIHVLYLDNADAEELAGTLNTLISGAGATRPTPGRGAPGAQQTAQAPAFEGQIKLTHDKSTNALVIVSSPKDFIALREVVKRLDLPRRQVFVEATILEVSLDKSRNLGLAYHGGRNVSIQGKDSLAFGGFQPGQISSLALSADLKGLIGGLFGPELSLGGVGITIPSIGVVFQLLQSNNDVNVLSAPNLLTTDNQPAEIQVGQDIPYLSGLGSLPIPGQGQGQGQQNPFSFGFGPQVQRKPVALKLKITPHVNESDFVRLEIDQQIEDLLSRNFEGLGPSWSTRTVKTTVVVRDQQPVVIGGLMADKISSAETKIPLLGDLPILGYLFKYTTRQKQKTNLLIFITPYIIKDQSDLQRIFEQKVREREEFIETFTAFSAGKFEPRMDFRRKRGLLAEIGQVVAQAEEDVRIFREAEEATRQRLEEGPVELPQDLPGAEPDGDDGPPDDVPPPPEPPHQSREE